MKKAGYPYISKETEKSFSTEGKSKPSALVLSGDIQSCSAIRQNVSTDPNLARNCFFSSTDKKIIVAMRLPRHSNTEDNEDSVLAINLSDSQFLKKNELKIAPLDVLNDAQVDKSKDNDPQLKWLSKIRNSHNFK